MLPNQSAVKYCGPGVPAPVVFQEGWRIALDLLARCKDVPHRWITADDEFGRAQDFRATLRQRGERYVVDVPSSTLVRDLEAAPPVQARRRGSQPKAPLETVAAWAAKQPADQWFEAETRPGEKGPIRVMALATRVHTTAPYRSFRSGLAPHCYGGGAESTTVGVRNRIWGWLVLLLRVPQ